MFMHIAQIRFIFNYLGLLPPSASAKHLEFTESRLCVEKIIGTHCSQYTTALRTMHRGHEMKSSTVAKHTQASSPAEVAIFQATNSKPQTKSRTNPTRPPARPRRRRSNPRPPSSTGRRRTAHTRTHHQKPIIGTFNS